MSFPVIAVPLVVLLEADSPQKTEAIVRSKQSAPSKADDCTFMMPEKNKKQMQVKVRKNINTFFSLSGIKH